MASILQDHLRILKYKQNIKMRNSKMRMQNLKKQEKKFQLDTHLKRVMRKIRFFKFLILEKTREMKFTTKGILKVCVQIKRIKIKLII